MAGEVQQSGTSWPFVGPHEATLTRKVDTSVGVRLDATETVYTPPTNAHPPRSYGLVAG